ncbi:hypothetical protein ACU8V3_08960 [Cobetia marina]
MPGEFELIARYFQRDLSGAPGVLLGPGDDCALLAAGDGMQLAISVDTSVAGVHFPPDAPASSIGHRAWRSIFPIWPPWGRRRAGRCWP